MSEMYFTGANSMFEPVSHISMYSDSTPMVKMPGWDRVVKRADTLTIRGGGMANFVTGMMLLDAVGEQGGHIQKVVLPYVPGARQDRVNPTGDVLFTLKSVARMLKNYSEQVVVLDPHSAETRRQIGRMRMIEYPLSRVAKMIPNRYSGIIAADKGGKDRAEQFGKAMDLPVYYGGKTRDVSTGKLTGFTLESIPTRARFLVVDDICDGGGTFNGLAAKIAEYGSIADLYVSHGIFSKGTKALEENYGEIFTTDSLAGSERNNVTVLAVVKEMENYNG